MSNVDNVNVVETVEVTRLVEKTVAKIVGRYLDPEGLWVPIVERETVLVPVKEA